MASTDTVPQFTVLDRMIKAREHAGYNQEQMAHELGVSLSTVRRLEKGTTPAKRVDLLGWASVTQVNVSWLLTGTIATGSDTDGYASQGILDFEYELVA